MNTSSRVTKPKPKPNEIDVYVGKTVRALRLSMNINQTELAKTIDVTFQQLQKYEKGSNRISASNLYKLCKKFNISMDDFFSGLENEAFQKKTEIFTHSKAVSRMVKDFQKIDDKEFENLICNLVKNKASNS